MLREEPPPQTASHRSRRFAVRWLPRAAALAMTLVLVWAGVRLWRSPAAPSAVTGTDNGETWSILDELPSNPFLLNEALAVELATESAGSYDLATTILESERPCEWYDLPGTGRAEPLVGDAELPGGLPFASCVEIDQKK